MRMQFFMSPHNDILLLHQTDTYMKPEHQPHESDTDRCGVTWLYYIREHTSFLHTILLDSLH